MQATVKGTWFGFGQVKGGIVALGIAAALAVGAATAISLNRDDSAAIGTSQAAQTFDQSAHQRFIELNTLLPEAARQATADFRFMELNIAPGDIVSPSVVGSAQMRFLEQNLLPAAAPAVKSAAEITFWDQNILPGDDQPMLPAYGQHGATDY